MVHEMNLQPVPFELIKSGQKTIELRLNDKKRQKIQIGDTIVFTKVDRSNETLSVIVKNLFPFPSFAELYQLLPLDKCGYLPDEIDTASPIDMELYYPAEKQNQYGVLGIEIALLD